VNGSAAPTEFPLGRDGQVHRFGLVIGIVAMSPDPADPAARLAVRVAGTGAGLSETVRPGDVLHAGGKAIRIAAVANAVRGHVDLVVWDEPAPERPVNENHESQGNSPGGGGNGAGATRHDR
jgi:hypothetical protein